MIKVVQHSGPWKNLESVEQITLEEMHWFNWNRIFKPLEYIPSVEFEKTYYVGLNVHPVVAELVQKLSEESNAIQSASSPILWFASLSAIDLIQQSLQTLC
ncbi:MAG: hypothetical protein HC888_16550 [Candidatus Competibacteraceae bacterium]|nr:hypothetical protein [Candidatus Competibacteraceae bacterium]